MKVNLLVLAALLCIIAEVLQLVSKPFILILPMLSKLHRPCGSFKNMRFSTPPLWLKCLRVLPTYKGQSSNQTYCGLQGFWRSIPPLPSPRILTLLTQLPWLVLFCTWTSCFWLTKCLFPQGNTHSHFFYSICAVPSSWNTHSNSE